MTKMQTSWQQVRERHIGAMQKSCDILGHILQGLTNDEARALRDGSEGWSIIEIVCHLRDFDEIFYKRAQMMQAQGQPQLPAYDHEAMAVERAYQQEDLAEALGALQASRARFVSFLSALTPEQWQRTGVHPERDSFTMTDAAMQVGLHDLDHLEQITRVLASQSGG